LLMGQILDVPGLVGRLLETLGSEPARLDPRVHREERRTL